MQYNTIRYNTIQYNTIQYNTIQYNTIQHNTKQYNAIQHITVQFSFDIALFPLSSEMHSHASPAQMQFYCREIMCEELAQGPYTVTVSNEARTRTLQVTDRSL